MNSFDLIDAYVHHFYDINRVEAGLNPGVEVPPFSSTALQERVAQPLSEPLSNHLLGLVCSSRATITLHSKFLDSVPRVLDSVGNVSHTERLFFLPSQTNLRNCDLCLQAGCRWPWQRRACCGSGDGTPSHRCGPCLSALRCSTKSRIPAADTCAVRKWGHPR